MKISGDALVKNHGFTRLSKEEVLSTEDIILFYGIYTLDDYNLLMSREYETSVYFCGSDIYWLNENKLLNKLCWNSNLYLNVGNEDQLMLLHKYQVSAKISPIFAEDMEKYSIVENNDNSVIVYIGHNLELYQVDDIVSIAMELPDISFKVFGRTDLLKDMKIPGNIELLGWLSQKDVDKLISQSAIYLRLTRTEGFSKIVVKALLSGKQVIYNHVRPFVSYAKDKEAAIELIKEKLEDYEVNYQAAFLYKQPYYINNWGRIFRYTQYPSVDILIANSERNREWFEDAHSSATYQSYPHYRIVVEDNPNMQKSIGKVFNDMVKYSDADYVFFLGDDDMISPDYIQSLVDNLLFTQEVNPEAVYATSYISYLREDGELYGYAPFVPTGLYLRSFLVENPFNEELPKLVDTEMISRISTLGYSKVILRYHFGYLYRQHDNMVSGRKKAVWELVKNEEKS